MSQAYRSNTEGEEEKYQEALSAYREKVKHAQSFSWVYTQRNARKQAGFVASLAALFCFPVSFWLFICAFFQGSKDPLRLMAWQWWPHSFALLLAPLPLLVFWLVYKISLQTKPRELQTIFEVPRRIESTPESTIYLQEQNPLEKLREECAKIAPSSNSWSFSASSLLSTQLPTLLLVIVVSMMKRLHPETTWHCWVDLTVIILFVSGLSFFGFYPFAMSIQKVSKNLIDDPNLTLQELEEGANGWSLAPIMIAFLGAIVAGVVVIKPLIFYPLRYEFVTPYLRAYLFFGLLLVPVAVAYRLGMKRTPKNLQKLQKAFAAEHAALYPPKK